MLCVVPEQAHHQVLAKLLGLRPGAGLRIAPVSTRIRKTEIENRHDFDTDAEDLHAKITRKPESNVALSGT